MLDLNKPQQSPITIKEEKIEIIDGKPQRITTMETTQPITKAFVQREIDQLNANKKRIEEVIADKTAQLELIPEIKPIEPIK